MVFVAIWTNTPQDLKSHYFKNMFSWLPFLTHPIDQGLGVWFEEQYMQGERGNWAVYYTSPQSFKLTFSYRWLNNFGDFLMVGPFG